MQTLLNKWLIQFSAGAPQTSRANTSYGNKLNFNPARGVDATPDDDPISQYAWGDTLRYDNSWGLYGSFKDAGLTEAQKNNGTLAGTAVAQADGTLLEAEEDAVKDEDQPLWYKRQKFKASSPEAVRLYKSRGFSTSRVDPNATNSRIIGYENSINYNYSHISANHNRFRQATYNAITTNTSRSGEGNNSRSFYD